MKFLSPLSPWLVLAVLGAPAWELRAQESIDLEGLKRELLELRHRTEQLERKIQRLEAPPALGIAPPSGSGSISNVTVVPGLTNSPAALEAAPSKDPARPWSPADPIELTQPGANPKFINLSLVGLGTVGTSTAEDVEALQLGGHDPRQRGFTLQNVELALEGRVDPYLRGQANTVLFLTPAGETQIELEEAYLESLSLPWNLQAKAGQFLTEFGRQNPSHPHTWDFVDAPLVSGRFFGEDGLRNPGARLSWLVPTPFYSELFLAVQNSHGETAHSFRSDREGAVQFGRIGTVDRLKALGDLLFVPRYALSFDLTDTQTILAGASGAFGPNATGTDSDTQILGADLMWKWKPASHHGGFPFVSWRAEGMWRRFEAGEYDGSSADQPIPLPGETLTDYGWYSQVSYGFTKGWVAALRGDYAGPVDRSEYEMLLGPDPDRTSRWRLAPNLTWFPSEFSKIRLQYNFDHRNQLGDDHSVWLQFEFLLGSHAAHKF